jgi:hypothetical protein
MALTANMTASQNGTSGNFAFKTIYSDLVVELGMTLVSSAAGTTQIKYFLNGEEISAEDLEDYLGGFNPFPIDRDPPQDSETSIDPPDKYPIPYPTPNS